MISGYVRARSSSSEASRQSFICCLHHVQQVMTLWAWLLRTKIHSRTIRSSFQQNPRVSVESESLTPIRFDQWSKLQEWYENFLRNFYFEGIDPSMGVCPHKERENSLIKGIKPTRDLRWQWRYISVKIVPSGSLSRSLASHNNFSILNSTMVKKIDTPDMSIFRWKFWKFVLISTPRVF